MGLLKYINFVTNNHNIVMSPPHQEVFRGGNRQKWGKGEFERKQKNKKGRKKRDNRDVARIFRVLGYFKALWTTFLFRIWFCIIEMI